MDIDIIETADFIRKGDSYSKGHRSLYNDCNGFLDPKEQGQINAIFKQKQTELANSIQTTEEKKKYIAEIVKDNITKSKVIEKQKDYIRWSHMNIIQLQGEIERYAMDLKDEASAGKRWKQEATKLKKELTEIKKELNEMKDASATSASAESGIQSKKDKGGSVTSTSTIATTKSDKVPNQVTLDTERFDTIDKSLGDLSDVMTGTIQTKMIHNQEEILTAIKKLKTEIITEFKQRLDDNNSIVSTSPKLTPAPAAPQTPGTQETTVEPASACQYDDIPVSEREILEPKDLNPNLSHLYDGFWDKLKNNDDISKLLEHQKSVSESIEDTCFVKARNGARCRQCQRSLTHEDGKFVVPSMIPSESKPDHLPTWPSTKEREDFGITEKDFKPKFSADGKKKYKGYNDDEAVEWSNAVKGSVCVHRFWCKFRDVNPNVPQIKTYVAEAQRLQLVMARQYKCRGMNTKSMDFSKKKVKVKKEDGTSKRKHDQII